MATLTPLAVLFFISLCLFPFTANSINPSLNDDVLGLIVFKAGIQDPDGKLASWNQEDDSPCNNWAGVTCNPRSNRVSDLVLDGYNLSGKLGRGLLQLKFLNTLSLARNNFSDNIALSFGQFNELRILDLSENAFSGSVGNDLFVHCWNLRSVSLSKNKLSGSIPESLSSCSSLALLNLSSNQFSGRLPPQTWSLSGLRSLDLSDNMLEGEIPNSIEGLNNLREIRLRNNRFSGEVPDGIGHCLLLKVIDFSRNLFSGELPSSIQKLSLGSDLILDNNVLTGDVPGWIGEMRTLETLDLSGNAFSGKVPVSLGKLQSLKTLNFSKNALTGSLPESISSCVNLLTVDVSHNSLTGNLPSWVFNLGLQQVSFSDNRLSGSIDNAVALSTDNSHRKLLVLDLSKNQLNGSIPMSIGNFVALVSLSLAINEITGSIPASLAKLANLQKADFSFNNLTGTLPKQLENLGHLQLFNISHNRLQGQLPSSPFFNTIDPSSVSDNPSLCGAAVNSSCPGVLPKPIVLDPNATDTTGATPGPIAPSFAHGKKILSISALIAIGAAVAIVVGVIAISVVNLRIRTAGTSQSAAAVNFYSTRDDLSHSSSTDADLGKLVMFSGDPQFSAGTHTLLNKDCELGRGGFGAVYRALLGDGRPVAVKKLTVSSLVKSREDFEQEVGKLGKVCHANLVALHGYYWTPSLQLLIYEFVSGGNLYAHLHEETVWPTLSWDQRFDIIIGTAKGLAQLHQKNIVHYNLKASNILIDSSGEPKVADYGLARLLPMLDRYVLSSKIQSALGYMAPEFGCKSVKITEKCDVYGFGILMLEIVTGKKPVEYMEDDVVVLSDMIRGALEEDEVEQCVDGRLGGNFLAEEAVPVMKLGLICTSQVPSNRPDMTEVVNILELIRCPDESGDFS